MFNLMKTAILMAAITALFIVIGGMLGGHEGMVLALLFALAMNFFSYWFSDKMVLRMTNAQEVDQNSAPQFYELVKELAAKAELPMPKVYLINEDSPNAFATGRNPEHAAVAATTGILRILSNRELRGVMAHELAHVKHRDILISTIAATRPVQSLRLPIWLCCLVAEARTDVLGIQLRVSWSQFLRQWRQA